MLGGHMRVGPQYRPPNPRGAQVIQRGPHGARLAPDPVVSRQGRRSGSGFQAWIENSPFLDENLVYLPPQYVVGVYGMEGLGAGTDNPYAYMTRVAGVIESRGVSLSTVCELGNTNSPLLQRVAAGAYPTEADLDGAIAEAGVLARQVKGSSNFSLSVQAMLCLARERTGQIGGGAASSRIRAISATHEILMSRLDIKRDDGSGRLAPGTVDPEGRLINRDPNFWGEFRSELQRLKIRTPGEWLGDNWWKIALGAGALVFFYGAGRGVAPAIFKRSK